MPPTAPYINSAKEGENVASSAPVTDGRSARDAYTSSIDDQLRKMLDLPPLPPSKSKYGSPFRIRPLPPGEDSASSSDKAQSKCSAYSNSLGDKMRRMLDLPPLPPSKSKYGSPFRIREKGEERKASAGMDTSVARSDQGHQNAQPEAQHPTSPPPQYTRAEQESLARDNPPPYEAVMNAKA